MKKNNLVIITGGCGSGKSTILKSTILKSTYKDYVTISVDDIKESLFDSYYDIKKSKMNYTSKQMMSDGSFNIFWKMLEELMKKSVNCVVEYPFKVWHVKAFNKLIKKYNYQCTLIIVYVSIYNRLKRQLKRIIDDSRHKGHHNYIGDGNFIRQLKDKLKKTDKKDNEKTKQKYIDLYNIDLLNKKVIIYDNNKSLKRL